MKAGNLALRLLVEVAALLAFGYWGFARFGGFGGMPVALGVGLVGGGLWALLAAPRSRRRLPDPARLVFECLFFATAGLALWSADHQLLAGLFVLVAVLNALAVRWLD